MIVKLLNMLGENILKILSYINREKYKELYPKYLRRLGVNILEGYRKDGRGFINPKAHFDGNDYTLISIRKNTIISG